MQGKSVYSGTLLMRMKCVCTGVLTARDPVTIILFWGSYFHGLHYLE